MLDSSDEGPIWVMSVPSIIREPFLMILRSESKVIRNRALIILVVEDMATPRGTKEYVVLR